MAPRMRVVGPGRAGGSLALALAAAGWEVAPPVGRDGDLAGAADDVDVVVVATPDSSVAKAAGEVRPRSEVVVVHMAGSLGLSVLSQHSHRASMHPLVSLPDPATGALRLAEGSWFALGASDEEGAAVVMRMVEDLSGRPVWVADEQRALHHASATIASNHLVALLGQVQRVAALAGVPLDAYLGLARSAVDNVAATGPAAALTGPVARGDWATVAVHRSALPTVELDAYDALMAAAARLVGAEIPGELRR